ncbi:MAG: hypothetical protein J7M11_02645, partial [Elusimicrobia bacterium]|nr:hypothetical protein [Elusimicrobiota bacterium]
IREYLPNIYFVINFVKDIPEDLSKGFQPYHSVGVKSISIIPHEHENTVKIIAPDMVEPNKEIEITINIDKSDRDCYAQIAVVDEGILQLTDFKTPAPIDYFFKKCALGVTSYGNYGWLMGKIGPETLSGGDSYGRGLLGKKRVTPVRIVSFWSGIIEVTGGKAKAKFKLPYFNGKLRVMAVVAGKKRMGHAESFITVRDPLLLMPSIPRFMTFDDSIRIPVNVTNFTGKKGSFKISVTGNDAVKLEKSVSEFSLGKKKEKTEYCTVKVKEFAGTAKLNFIAAGNGKTTKDSYSIPIIPPVFEQTVVHKVKLLKGKNNITEKFKGWVPEYERDTLLLSGMPYLNGLLGIKRLVRYPYGCIEQTTSSTFPLLYITDIINQLDPSYLKDKDVHEMVMKGVDRIISMQTMSGGFSYWPGGNQASEWSSVYATHMLFEAKKAGFPVPQAALNNALNYLNNLVTHYNYQYYKPYAYMVLALAGKQNANKIRQDITRLENNAVYYRKGEELFLMGAALYLSGKKDEGMKFIGRYIDEIPLYRRYNDISFYSTLRYLALKLYVLESINPGGMWSEKYANAIAGNLGQRSNYHYYTTQELAWSVMALGKRMKSLDLKELKKASLITDGTEHKIKKSKGGYFLSAEGLSAYKNIILDVSEKSYVYISINGYPDSFSREAKYNGIKMDIASYDITGGLKSLESGYKAGDLGIIEVTIQNLTSMNFTNTAAVIRIPSGFEIENPRLKGSHKPSWIDEDQWEVQHMDIRDDRIEMFGHLNSGRTVKFYFAVRAAFKGNFTMPGSSAEVMYLPDYYFYGKLRSVEVK